MKAIVRKEVHLPEPQAKLLDKAARASKVSLKAFMESILIAEANKYKAQKVS